nr:family 78 glycoside hydrolase catalytic domain [Planctomycetota bacterium]
PARWEMGFTDKSQWRARWIARTTALGPQPAPMLRKPFAVRGALTRARLYACGLGYGEFALNGATLGDALLEPGYTRFDRRALYVAHDVTAALKQGDNVLGAQLGTGWYDVHTLAVWFFEKAPWRSAPKMLCELHLDYADGRHEVVLSDATWTTTTGPIVYDSIYGGETYDARLERAGWNAPGYDAREWQPAIAVDGPPGLLSWEGCPPIRVHDTLKAKSIREVQPGVHLVDLGQNCAGHARITVSGAKPGTTITLRYGERLNERGLLETAKTGEHMTRTDPPQRFQTDQYLCKGGASETWEARFSYHGGCYVEVSGWPGALTPDMIVLRAHATDSPRTGRFSCSDALVNRIYESTIWSYRANAQSIPTDCPHREKNGWTGDAHLACEFGLATFDSAAFYEKWLDDLHDEQRDDGMLPGIVPSSGWGYEWGNGPAWDSAYPLICWYLYRTTGDAWALTRHYDRLKRYVDFMGTRAVDGVIPWGLGDWLFWKAETPVEVTSTGYWHVDALIVAEAAKLLGKSDDERRYRDLAATIRATFRERFVRADGGVANDSQCALSCALHQGLIDGAKPATVAKVVAAIDATNGHIDAGILGAKYLFNALHDAGRDDVAMRMLTRTEQPGWGWWLGQGATTLWEDWKGESSLNHIMFGDVSAWMVKALAGIDQSPESRGYTAIVIDPQPVGGCSWAKAELPTPRGVIISSWTQGADGAFTLDVTIPPGEPALVYLPERGAITESGKPVAQAEGVAAATDATTRAQRRALRVGSGSYRFVCR